MLFKKLIRTMFHYKAQFISMIIMMFLAVVCMVGINSEWYGMECEKNTYYKQTNLANYWAYSNDFSDEEYSKLASKFTDVERKTVIDVNVLENKTLSVNIVEEHKISKCYIVKGESFSNKMGIWLSDIFASKNGLDVGDNINVPYANMNIELEIKGLIKSPEYVYCTEDESVLMPDYSNFGYAYVSASLLESFPFPYTTLMIKSDLTKEEVKDIVCDIDENAAVISRSEFTRVLMLDEEIKGNRLVASIFPWFFLLIAFLTMTTTMTRITNNDRIQIGTLKALGFKNSRIIWHYTSFGLTVGVIGAVIGMIVGPTIIGKMLIDAQSNMYDMPVWKTHIQLIDALVVISMILLMMFATYLSCFKMLKGTASECLRERDPKIKKTNKIESSAIWKKLPFYVSWNIRDIFRNKIRSLMTIIGVMGCMGLLLCAVGFNDSINKMVKVQYETLYQYEYRTTLNNVTDEQIEEIKSKYETSSINAIEVLTNKGYKSKSLEIYDVDEMIKFNDANNKEMEIKDDGLYLTKRLSDSLDLKVNDVVKWRIYGSNIEYETRIAGITRAPISQGLQMTEKYALENGIDFRINTVYSNETIDDSFVETVQTKGEVEKAFDELMGTFRSIIYLLIGVAVVLGLVVLYNLAMLSYVERYRELSTLKVIGFNNQKINKIIITQNIWMAIIGIFVGIVFGNAILNVMVKAMPDTMDFVFDIKALTYIICIGCTLAVTVLVNIIIFRKVRKIDMVSSLKRE